MDQLDPYNNNQNMINKKGGGLPVEVVDPWGIPGSLAIRKAIPARKTLALLSVRLDQMAKRNRRRHKELITPHSPTSGCRKQGGVQGDEFPNRGKHHDETLQKADAFLVKLGWLPKS